ncbi:hypothetical protein Tco_1385422 [Tanacetum coccineum]
MTGYRLTVQMCLLHLGLKKEEVIRGCVGKGENKEDKVDKKHVFWAPAPLTVKSWVDVDDEDYYAITASSPVWGVGAGKDDKVAPLEVSSCGELVSRLYDVRDCVILNGHDTKAPSFVISLQLPVFHIVIDVLIAPSLLRLALPG